MTFASGATNDYLTGRKPVLTPSGAEVIGSRFALDLATADLATNQIGEIGILPAGCVPVELLFDSDDLDSNGTPTIAWDIGISNANVTNNIQAKGGTAISTATADGGAAWVSAATTSQAGGQAQLTSKALSRVQAVNYDRYILAKASTGSATAVAGQIGLTLTVRPA